MSMHQKLVLAQVKNLEFDNFHCMIYLHFMLNIFDTNSRSLIELRHRLKNDQISHYLLNGSDSEIKTLSQIKGFICFSNGSLLLKYPVFWGNFSHPFILFF